MEEHCGATDDERRVHELHARPGQDGDPRHRACDGRPHAAPIWFDLDGNTVVFTTGESTVKGRNMRRDARVSLCIDEEEPPFHFVVIEGAADLTAGDPDLLY